MHKTIAIVSATGALLFGGAGVAGAAVQGAPAPSRRPQHVGGQHKLVTPNNTTVTAVSGACSACLDCSGWLD